MPFLTFKRLMQTGNDVNTILGASGDIKEWDSWKANPTISILCTYSFVSHRSGLLSVLFLPEMESSRLPV